MAVHWHLQAAAHAELWIVVSHTTVVVAAVAVVVVAVAVSL